MKTTYILPYRRKREGKTDYRRRLALLKSRSPRLIVRKTSTKIIAQIAEFTPKGDKIIVTADSLQLTKMGWKGSRKNIPAAYLVGMMAGKKAQQKGVKKAILDSGMITTTKGSRIYAALKGAKDSGLKIDAEESILPPQDRIEGKHIQKYAEAMKKEAQEAYSKRFSQYIKDGITPEDITKQFEQIKAKIMQG